MKRKFKKLEVQRETLRSLAEQDMRRVAGGTTDTVDPSCCMTNTFNRCPVRQGNQ
jgi:natural product precursor